MTFKQIESEADLTPSQLEQSSEDRISQTVVRVFRPVFTGSVLILKL